MPRLDVARFLALTSALASSGFAACAARQSPEPQTAPTVAVVDVPSHEDTVEDDGDGGAPVQVIEEPLEPDTEQPAPYVEGAPYDEYGPDPGGEAGLSRRRDGGTVAIQGASGLGFGTSSSPGWSGLSGVGTSPPRLRSGSPKLVGSLPPAVVQRIVRSRQSSIRYCYEKALLKNPKLSGKITVRFAIAANGSVANVTKKGGGVEPAVDSCVLGVFKRLRFPSRQGGGVVVVNYPLIFASQ
jgi:hypothetical protein